MKTRKKSAIVAMSGAVAAILVAGCVQGNNSNYKVKESVHNKPIAKKVETTLTTKKEDNLTNSLSKDSLSQEVPPATSKKAEENEVSNSVTEKILTDENSDSFQSTDTEQPKALVQNETPEKETVTSDYKTEVTTLPTQSIEYASIIATTQYSHTTSSHNEGEVYSVPSSPVTITGNTLTGTITRTGVGLEKASIVLSYVLNFDDQGCYISGSVTSSGYITPQINLSVGKIYNGYIDNAITTSYGHALSGSLLYPICAGLNL